MNETGCSWAQRDDDADGVLNADDLCRFEINSVVDEDGCADSQETRMEMGRTMQSILSIQSKSNRL